MLCIAVSHAVWHVPSQSNSLLRQPLGVPSVSIDERVLNVDSGQRGGMMLFRSVVESARLDTEL